MNKIKEAQNFMHYVRRVHSNKKNWPTPVEYIRGNKNERVYATNNGRLMKITLKPSIENYKLLKNRTSVPIIKRRSTYIKPALNLFNNRLKNTVNYTTTLRKYQRNKAVKLSRRFKHMNNGLVQIKGEMYPIKNFKNYEKKVSAYTKNLKRHIIKRAYVFLMKNPKLDQNVLRKIAEFLPSQNTVKMSQSVSRSVRNALRPVLNTGRIKRANMKRYDDQIRNMFSQNLPNTESIRRLVKEYQNKYKDNQNTKNAVRKGLLTGPEYFSNALKYLPNTGQKRNLRHLRWLKFPHDENVWRTAVGRNKGLLYWMAQGNNKKLYKFYPYRTRGGTLVIDGTSHSRARTKFILPILNGR